MFFGQHGEIDFINLHMDPETGRSKGYGFIQFKRPDDAKKALAQCNGMEIAGRQIKVGLVNDTNKEGTGMLGELDDDEGGGLSLNAVSRAILMQKLQRESIMPPEDKKASPPRSVTPPPQQHVSPPNNGIMSPCVMLKNMFSLEQQTDPSWEEEIKEDVREECSKFGSVVHIFVDKYTNGHVYLKFGTIPGAQNAIYALNGRWFAGNQVSAEMLSEEKYYKQFPESFSK